MTVNPAEGPADLHGVDLSPSEVLASDLQRPDMRCHAPLVRTRLAHGQDAWLATRYEDVRLVLRDQRFSRRAAAELDEPRARPNYRGNLLMTADPPEHTRLRRAVTVGFTPRSLEKLRPRIQHISDGLIDRMVGQGSVGDLVADFAEPFAARVISEVVGVIYHEGVAVEQQQLWSDVLHSTSASAEQLQDARDSVWNCVVTAAMQNSNKGGDDLLSVMQRDAASGKARISRDELFALASQQYTGGYDSPAALLPNFVFVLLMHPPRLAELRRELALAPSAVEELLRYAPLLAGPQRARYAMEDVVVGGITVRTGEPVLPFIAAANMDPQTFSHPRRLDLRRHPNPHLGLGDGIHHCLGAYLARMYMQIALTAILRRLPMLHLAVDAGSVQWKPNCIDRKLMSLPVAW